MNLGKASGHYVDKTIIRNIQSDMDFFQKICSNEITCDCIETYNQIMKWCWELHITPYGNPETLIINL